MNSIPITREKYEEKRAELDHLENVIMPEILSKLSEARAEGDLKENAEYHGQREAQGHTDRKIKTLKAQLANCFIVEKDDKPKDSIVFGTRVTLLDLDEDDEEIYEFVGMGEDEFDGDVWKVRIDSPLGAQLAHHKEGEEVEVNVPAGVLRYKIIKIESADV